MRFLVPAALAVAVLAIPALAQNETGKPDTVACPKDVADIATCYEAKLATGNYVFAAMPKTWNGDLIVYAHGGPFMEDATAASAPALIGRNTVEVKRGFAWIGSTYRREGYGVTMAADDTEDARKFFIDRIAKPKRTILHGTSYGGLVSAKLIELHPKSYDGALLNSGLVSGPVLGYAFRADLRAVYQYYCKNLPRPDEAQYPLWMGLGPDVTMSMKEMEARVDECTGVSKPEAERTETQKQNLANIIGVMKFTDKLLIRHMQSATFLFREVAQRVTSGKSAFSNMGVVYKGSSDDAALNRGVARFSADPDAVAALKREGEPMGALAIPMVSIHSINDPQVAVETQAAYRDTVKSAGHDANLVQAFTDEDQHAAQSAPELAAALDGLMQWLDKGTKPTPQSIAAACAQMKATYDGPCRYHPEFEPKPYATRFYARQMTASR